MQGDGKELESLQHFIQISEFSGRAGFHPLPLPHGPIMHPLSSSLSSDLALRDVPGVIYLPKQSH